MPFKQRSLPYAAPSVSAFCIPCCRTVCQTYNEALSSPETSHWRLVAGLFLPLCCPASCNGRVHLPQRAGHNSCAFGCMISKQLTSIDMRLLMRPINFHGSGLKGSGIFCIVKVGGAVLSRRSMRGHGPCLGKSR